MKVAEQYILRITDRKVTFLRPVNYKWLAALIFEFLSSKGENNVKMIGPMGLIKEFIYNYTD